MPKVTLTFKLPDEQKEFDLTSKASNLHTVLWELDQHLRKLTKYAPDNMPDEEYKAYETIREKLWELVREEGVDL